MNVGWLLDASVFDTYHDELAAAIVRNGDQVVSLNRPKPPYNWDDTASAYRQTFPQGACVVTHADIDLVQRVIADQNWAPGAFATVDRFFCSHYFPRFGRFLLNRDYIMLPFGELARRADFLFETLGRDGQLFIRPDSPLKLFTGLIASRDSFAKDLDFMGFYEFPIESLVVVSSPKSIVKEWRFVIVDGAVVAGSQYKEAEKFVHVGDYDPNAHALASAIAGAGYAPDPVWVLDICQTQGNEYHLLEIGGFSFANLYACNKDDVVKSVSKAARGIWEENCA